MSTAIGSDRDDLRARLGADAEAVIARYPKPRSALLPLLHLVQSEQSHVTPEGIEFCAEMLGLSTAEVTAVATFYTQFKRHPVGEYAVGVCTNTLCAVLGGDAILDTLKKHLGVSADQTTADGTITLEHLECNAACDYAPVVMVNWEFFDNVTPQSAIELVDALRAGNPPLPSRGASLCSFREISRVLAGFYDGRAGEGPSAGPATLAGLRLAERQEQGAPDPDGSETSTAAVADAPSSEEVAATAPTGYGVAGGPSGSDAGVDTSASDEDHPAPAAEGLEAP